MSMFDWIGYVASTLVFLAFMMRGIVMVRLVALLSNFAFLAYGIGLHLLPVAALHLVLIPVNCWRLWQTLYIDQSSLDPDVSASAGTTGYSFAANVMRGFLRLASRRGDLTVWFSSESPGTTSVLSFKRATSTT